MCLYPCKWLKVKVMERAGRDYPKSAVVMMIQMINLRLNGWCPYSSQAILVFFIYIYIYAHLSLFIVAQVRSFRRKRYIFLPRVLVLVRWQCQFYTDILNIFLSLKLSLGFRVNVERAKRVYWCL